MHATIPTLRRTAERIMEQLTTTRRPEPTAGHRLLMVSTVRQREARLTIRTRGPPHEGPQSRHPTAVEVQHRPIIRTPEPMLRPDKVRVQPLNGVAPTCRGEIKALPWAITRPRMEQ